MSDLLSQKTDCKSCLDHPDKAVKAIFKPHEKDLGGFSVRRMMPTPELSSVGPFVFFDHLGPAHFAPGSGIDVRPHPHIGLATITYVFTGEILHRDSLGSVQPIRPGEINWMTAGRGIVHSERTPPDIRTAGHTLHALQLWVALPESDEQTNPGFFHYESTDLPITENADSSIRVMVGEAYGMRSAVRTWSSTLYVEVDLTSGSTVRLPDHVEERAVYVVHGGLSANGIEVAAHSMAVFEQAPEVDLVAQQQTKLVIIGGSALGHRTVWWNLVATRKELIERAKQDWRDGRFPDVPGESERIPLPES